MQSYRREPKLTELNRHGVVLNMLRTARWLQKCSVEFIRYDV